MKARLSSIQVAVIALSVVLCVVVVFVVFAHHLVTHLAEAEKQKMELWAEATRQFIKADENTDISLISSIIEANTTIPVYMLDFKGNVMLTRNVRRPIDDPTTLNGPIEVRVTEDIVQYIYYDESIVLKELHHLPWILAALMALFVLIAVTTLWVALRSEQNRVWVGLSKETAHQLGTPISSLMAWHELLHNRYPDDELVSQMDMDIQRLQTIAERFSKVGSVPELEVVTLAPLVEQTVEYMGARLSQKIKVGFEADTSAWEAKVAVCPSLLAWVMENILKNAADAIAGTGSIMVRMQTEQNRVCLDITDTGKGIERGQFSAVFTPGYTTKTRGWGLGLSLSKRIIENYHRGKIFVKQSQVGRGTTFRIVFKQAEDGAPTA